MTVPIVEARDISLEYVSATRRVQAIRGLDLAVQAGEFVGVLGPSGSGKSSLLFLLAGLRQPTRGHVLFRGAVWPSDVAEAADSRREALGLVFSEPFLIPYLTVRENALLQSLPSMSPTKLEELADAVSMTDLLDEYAYQLSGGQCQRASILRALMNEPALVLADEPTAHLDREGGLQVVSLLRQSVGDSSLVVASHDPRMLDAADRIFRLDDGVFVTDSTS